MTRALKTGRKASKAKARKASPEKGHKTAKADKAKRRITQTAHQKGRSVANLEAQLKLRTKEAEEFRQQQAATAEILKVINTSKGDLGSVFDIILEKAHSLCDVTSGSLQLLDGDKLRAVAVRGMTAAFEKFLRQGFRISDRLRQSIQPHKPIETADLAEALSRIADEPGLRAAVELGRIRTTLSVALAKDGVVLGRIVAARKKVRPFTGQQIALLQGFADQAVIAMENARLFNETREALERQTATADILKVIASSPSQVEPVLKAIVKSARELCAADDAVVHLREGDSLRTAAHYGPIPVGMHIRMISRNFASGRAVSDKVAVHIHDILSAEGDDLPEAQEMSRRSGIRTILCVPLLRENESIGTILLRRTEVAPFSDKQISLLQTFADQAVIAIENARLFNETKEALERQMATAEVLEAISGSISDAAPVFERIVGSTGRLFASRNGGLFLVDENEMLHCMAARGPNVDAIRTNYPMPMQQTGLPLVIEARRQVCFHSVLKDVGVPESLRRIAGPTRMGDVSIAITPLMWRGNAIGMLNITREPGVVFSEKELSLLRTFADQAVIAIQNARLFNEVQERTRELSQSLDDLKVTQDRLVQTEKLASLGQLTAGIAHEIKNPLNFVNNFSSLSAELVDELDETLLPAPLDQKMRGDVSELTQMLKSNLGKVVQHGKRANSIVKNILLHSREGSGEHRSADINALVEESLNLAYHGARAEKPDFNITLKRDLDPNAGEIELYPQEITRALLNLISNGFYAATKRKSEGGDETFEPILSAATRKFGDRVEIRIRDNGTGIPPNVKEKMFNPFFTTKPAGEGTGLGLSMSHDIVVKQHGGRIDIETEPGQFTEFTVVLPRKSSNSNEIRGKT